MNRSSTPRSLVELRNAIALVREAYTILDLDSSLRNDPVIEKLSNRTYDLLCDLREKLETKHTDLGWGWAVEPTIEITNKVKV